MRARLGRFHHRGSQERPEVNLTPLIDVVFVILIMFIVIAPLLEMDEVQLAEGSHEGMHTLSDSSAIVIRVSRDNTICLNDEKVTLPMLTESFVRAKQRNPKAVPQLIHDRQASFGTYQAIKNALERAGFSEMDVILSPNQVG